MDSDSDDGVGWMPLHRQFHYSSTGGSSWATGFAECPLRQPMLVGPAAKHAPNGAPKRRRMECMKDLMSPPSMGSALMRLRCACPFHCAGPFHRCVCPGSRARGPRLASHFARRPQSRARYVRGHRFLIPWSKRHSQFQCHMIFQIHSTSADSSRRRRSSISSECTSRATSPDSGRAGLHGSMA